MVLSFYILGIVAVASALMVVTRRNPMHSALWLLVTFSSLAGIYLLLNAEFVAAVQIIIYAGGIVILYVFVIMLVDLSKEASLRAAFASPGQSVFALVFAFLLLIVVIWIGLRGIEPLAVTETVAAANTPDTTRMFARHLFLTYLYPFEIASVLLLVAMIGSVILARRSRPADSAAGEKEVG